MEISPIVRSEFGLHLVTVSDIRGGDAQLRGCARRAETEQRSELAKKEFQTLEQFSNAVHEQADALQLVAEKFQPRAAQSRAGRVLAAGAQGPGWLAQADRSCSLRSL
ncbi:MAG: hypothetical protein U1E77_14335 [Inhella sp.]